MKIPLIFILIIIFSILPAECQNKNVLSGRVLSLLDSAGIEYAHVYLKNFPIGTYTNSEGQFSFHYPDSLKSDTLVISRVGYQRYFRTLSQERMQINDIYLNEVESYLDEVVVYAARDTMDQLIQKVFRNFRRNYPTKLHYLEGFYRELSTQGNRYTRLLEASVGITENSYRKSETTTRIKVRQIRKSEDYRSYDLNNQLYLKAFLKVMKLSGIQTYLHYNNLNRLLYINIPKSKYSQLTDKKNSVSDFLERHEFFITKIHEENGNKLCRIRFQYPPETSGAFMFAGGEMVINLHDYAIIESSWGIIPHPYKKRKNINPEDDTFFYKGKYHRQFHVIYSKFDKKYYPTYFELHEPILEGETHTYEGGKKEYQYNKITLMVNRVVTSKKEFDRIKKKEALEDELDLYDVDHPYDPEFWTNYNILLLDPLLKPAKEDLEKEKSLETQFEENGE